jgi:hypothetical protein
LVNGKTIKPSSISIKSPFKAPSLPSAPYPGQTFKPAPMSRAPAPTTQPKETISVSTPTAPKTTGVIFQSGTGTIRDVKSGLILKPGEGVINIEGGALHGGISRRIKVTEPGSAGALGALTRGIQTAQADIQREQIQQQVQSQQKAQQQLEANISLATGGVGFAAPSGRITPLTPISTGVIGEELFTRREEQVHPRGAPSRLQIPRPLFFAEPAVPLLRPEEVIPSERQPIPIQFIEGIAETILPRAEARRLEAELEIVGLAAAPPIFKGAGRLVARGVSRLVGREITEKTAERTLVRGLAGVIIPTQIVTSALAGEPIPKIAGRVAVPLAAVAALELPRRIRVPGLEFARAPTEKPAEFKFQRVVTTEEPVAPTVRFTKRFEETLARIPSERRIALERFRETQQQASEVARQTQQRLVQVTQVPETRRLTTVADLQRAFSRLSVIERSVLAEREPRLATSIF